MHESLHLHRNVHNFAGTRSCRDNLQKPAARDARVLSPSATSSRDATHADLIYFLTVADGQHSLWDASPGVVSQLPVSLGRFWGRRSFVRSTIARWQEATDPQSPAGGSQQACHTRGAHTTASGRHERVALIEQTALLWQLGSCLFGLPALGPSRPLRRLLRSLSQRGCN